MSIPRDNPASSEAGRNFVNRYLYNEKELQAGSGYLDYGARMYMPEIGRWGAVDPLAEKWNPVSPYNFTLNNPLNLLDPDGQDVIERADRTEYTGEDAAAMGALYGAGKGDSGGNQGTKEAEDKEKKKSKSKNAIDSPNVKAAEAKSDFSVEDRLAASGWKPGQQMPPMDGIGSDNSFFLAAIPLARPVELLAAPLIALIRAQFLGKMLAKEAANGVVKSSVKANRAAGNEFRDELAGLLRQEGRSVATEVYKKTPFGKRYIDIEVSSGGKVLGGIETKVGGSRYNATQRTKDAWLYLSEGYRVNVVRKPN